MEVKLVPAKTDAPSTCQVCPPSVDLSRPSPAYESLAFGSPVPAKIIEGLLGAKATAPIASAGWSSVRGVQFTPELVVSQTPPCAAPISQCALLVGSTAAHVIRPLTGPEGAICPFTIGAGPILAH